MIFWRDSLLLLSMGVPKQKWSAEEEGALKAGVLKHGAGKWRTILKDPEFARVLYLRSNVDLKDKWRNLSVMVNGWGSRDNYRTHVTRRMPHVSEEDSSMAISGGESDEEVTDAKPMEPPSDSKQVSAPKRSIVRLDDLIIEAITSLKDPGGSNKTAIAAYIEQQYWAPPDFKRLLLEKLKFSTVSGKLIKVKRRYRVAPTPTLSEKRNPFLFPFEGRPRVSLKSDKDERVTMLMRTQIDLELAKMRTMTSQEAAAAAARAVAEAEDALAEAEEAAKEAEAAEADAEVAQAYADAAMKSLRGRNPDKMVKSM